MKKIFLIITSCIATLSVWAYDFMVDNDATSKINYHKYFAEGKLSNGKNLFDDKYNKYTFK